MRKVNQIEYLENPTRYELRKGTTKDAPLCPYGNHYQWIGYDLKTKEYIRFTKAIFKKLVQEIE